MKLKITFLTVLLIAGALSTQAQTSTVTDAELLKYAVASDSLKKITEQFNQASLKIANDPKIIPARQQQLARTQGDSLKLIEIKATPYEKAYIKKVKEQRKVETSKFQRSYSSLITDYVGSDLYAKVTKELRTDAKLKHKYDSIASTLVKKKP